MYHGDGEIDTLEKAIIPRIMGTGKLIRWKKQCIMGTGKLYHGDGEIDTLEKAIIPQMARKAFVG